MESYNGQADEPAHLILNCSKYDVPKVRQRFELGDKNLLDYLLPAPEPRYLGRKVSWHCVIPALHPEPTSYS